MHRPNMLFYALFMSVAVSTYIATTTESAFAQQSAQPPNIIYIMADDLGYRELGCYGQEKIKTPNIDRMAAEGMRFTQYYTASPVCASCRCSLMTGKHGGHAYVRSNAEVGTWDSFRGQLPLPADEITIAEVLKQAGYATGAFGKWGLGEVGSAGDPLTQGFDRFFGYNCQRHAHNYYPRYLVDNDGRRELAGNDRGATGEQYAPQLIADELLKFIRQHKEERFFIYYPTIIPHLALQAPDEEIAAYRGMWDDPPYEGKSYQPHPTPRACYAAMISFMDKQVGRIMALLDELGLDENTIVFFTSDNGTTMAKAQVDYEFFNSVGELRGLKGEVYEGGIRMPLIVRWPGRIEPGAVSEHLAAHYDTLATLAELTGQKAPRQTDGVSYLQALVGQAEMQRQHNYLFWDFAGYGGQLAVRMGDWKGVKTGLSKNPDAPLELYNLESDIGESRNLAAEHPAIVEQMENIIFTERDEPEFAKFRFGKYAR